MRKFYLKKMFLDPEQTRVNKVWAVPAKSSRLVKLSDLNPQKALGRRPVEVMILLDLGQRT